MITEHAAGRLVYDAHYLEIEHTDGIVVVQGLLSADRTTEEEQAFYARATDFLARGAKGRAEDVTIALVENSREDWSFGNGSDGQARRRRHSFSTVRSQRHPWMVLFSLSPTGSRSTSLAGKRDKVPVDHRTTEIRE